METLGTRPTAAFGAEGNRQERGTRVQQILERLGRLEREHDEISAEVKRLTDEIERSPNLYGPPTTSPN